MTTAPVPDPRGKPVSSDELEKDAPLPDDGPLIDTGPAEIDVEREAAGVQPEKEPGRTPEIEMPPD
ncbi:hypothetical protein [Tsuneonella amylolytica]|uniref:hypothetical protein n=1 Tax=Tsuneonella amylolytica TaxID=2338327 RepID=UPI000EA975E9|nr:hypothetical protein [Tsuneonella amylolytica]